MVLSLIKMSPHGWTALASDARFLRGFLWGFRDIRGLGFRVKV